MAITYPLSLPTAGGIRSVRLGMMDVVAVGASPFTGQQQVQQHAGQWWDADIGVTPGKRADAEEWIAFLGKLKGRRGTFLLGDPAATSPRGTIAGTPVVDGAHAARAATLALRGLTVGTTLLAGDYVQVGSGATTRLHKNLSNATADGTGKMTLDIWPDLREALSDGAAIVTSSAKGLFRLATNKRDWSVDESLIYGISFSAMEAI